MAVEFQSRDHCAISGIGTTDYSTKSERSVLNLAADASLSAIRDAGLSPDDIDGLVLSGTDALHPGDLTHGLGLNLTYWGSTGGGGNGTCGMIAQAVAAVVSQQASTVLVVKSMNGASGMRFGAARDLSNRVGGNGSLQEFVTVQGLIVPGQIWALIAQRHMHEYGTTSEQLGHVAVACRNRANANPRAQMFARKLTLEDHRDAPRLATPLGRYDYCLQTDGACAVIVTSRERARSGPNRPAVISAAVQATNAMDQSGPGFAVAMREHLTTTSALDAARLLYSRAGIGPSEIDVAQLYDCFTISVVVQLEDYGFCRKGEGGAFAASGAIEPGGVLPINTAGGNLSEAYLQGMGHVLEGVRQIRGESTSQVSGAETCLVTSGLPNGTSAMILRVDA